MKRVAVVGSGPNGLAAAIVLGQAGHQVTVLEAAATPGGGTRTQALTLPGFRHDVCSAIHPLAVLSPFFRSLPLEAHGLRWINPPIAVAHPFDDGGAAILHRSAAQTASLLGRDAEPYLALMQPLLEDWPGLTHDILGPVQRLPRRPLRMARFGLHAVRSAAGLANARFREERTRALLGGLAAHANLPLTARFSAGFGLVLGMAAHATGWPAATSGSQAIADALTGHLGSLGGRIVTQHRVTSIDELDDNDAVLFDLTPRQVIQIAGDRLSPGYRRALQRFRPGPGVFKIDYALDGPIPWTAPACRETATVHLGGSLTEMIESEAAIAAGRSPARPYVIVTQPSLFDSSRAPEGKHTGWAYCHVPHGATDDMTERIEAQIERFAPGFRGRVLARHTMSTQDFERYNSNYIGGDIGGGAYDGLQLFLRPTLRRSPYTTSDARLFICSASTPPGAGVHGMSGYHAAQAVLRSLGR